MSPGARISNQLIFMSQQQDDPSYLISFEHAARLSGMSMEEFGFWLSACVGRFSKYISVLWLWSAFRYAVWHQLTAYGDLTRFDVIVRRDGVQTYDMLKVLEEEVSCNHQQSWPEWEVLLTTS